MGVGQAEAGVRSDEAAESSRRLHLRGARSAANAGRSRCEGASHRRQGPVTPGRLTADGDQPGPFPTSCLLLALHTDLALTMAVRLVRPLSTPLPLLHRALATKAPYSGSAGSPTTDPIGHCRALVRQHDPDAFLSSYFYPAGRPREAFWAYRALNVRLSSHTSVQKPARGLHAGKDDLA